MTKVFQCQSLMNHRTKYSTLTWFFTNKNKPYSSVPITFIISENLLVVWAYFEQDSVILIRFSKPVEVRNLLIFYSIYKKQFLVFGWIEAKYDKHFSKMPKYWKVCINIFLVTMTSFPTCWPFQNIKIKINHANFFKNLVRISEYGSKWIPILEYCQKIQKQTTQKGMIRC